MALSDILARIKSALGIDGAGGRQRGQPTGPSDPEGQSEVGDRQDGSGDDEGHHAGATSNSVDVTVEREPDTETEDAVKGTDTAAEPAVGTEPVTESIAAEDAENGAGETGETAEASEADATSTGQAVTESVSEDEGADETAEASEADTASTGQAVTESVSEDEASSETSEAETDEAAEASEADTASAGQAVTESVNEEEATSEAEDTQSEADEETGDAEEAAGTAGTGESVDVIKGIGPTYADRLGEAGVETVDDLADSDAETLAEAADVPEGRLENWIERARHRR